MMTIQALKKEHASNTSCVGGKYKHVTSGPNGLDSRRRISTDHLSSVSNQDGAAVWCGL